MTTYELWVEYVALGGDASPMEMEAFLQGALQPGRFEYDKVAHALNERFMVTGRNHPVPYWQRDDGPPLS